MGLGALYMTRDKAEEISQELIRRGELAKEEKSDFISKLMDNADKQKNMLKEKLEKEFNAMVKEANLITRDEYEELLSKINELNIRLAELENKFDKE